MPVSEGRQTDGQTASYLSYLFATECVSESLYVKVKTSQQVLSNLASLDHGDVC